MEITFSDIIENSPFDLSKAGRRKLRKEIYRRAELTYKKERKSDNGKAE